MDSASLLELLGLLGTFLCVILAVFLIAVPSRNALANRMFAGFLLLTALDISGWFMDAVWQANPLLDQMRIAAAFLQMPLFLGFVWFSCFEDEKLEPRHLVHLLPALVVAVSLALFSSADRSWLVIAVHLQYYIYIVAAIWTLACFRHILRNHFSSSRSRTLEWLTAMVAVSFFAHAVVVGRVVIVNVVGRDWLTALQVASALIVLAITLWIAFRALLSPDLFRGVDKVLASAASEIRQSGAGEDQPSASLDRLLAHIEERQPFLDPELSLSRLARQSGVPAKELSALINQRIGMHFFDFINGYRVDHASALLLAERDMTVTDVLYASGFNSKSSFNTAFKKHQGQTPSAWRKEASAKKNET